MIKGWRNDPQWIKYYQEKKDAIARLRMERIKIDMEEARIQRDMAKLCLDIHSPGAW